MGRRHHTYKTHNGRIVTLCLIVALSLRVSGPSDGGAHLLPLFFVTSTTIAHRPALTHIVAKRHNILRWFIELLLHVPLQLTRAFHSPYVSACTLFEPISRCLLIGSLDHNDVSMSTTERHNYISKHRYEVRRHKPPRFDVLSGCPTL